MANTAALIASRPPSQPLFHFYQYARRTNPQAHKFPLHAYFQSPTADTFKTFADIQRPNPAIPLSPTPNFNTLILQDKDRAIQSIKVLRPSEAQVLVFSDGSRIDSKNTAAAAWCANNKHFSSHQLGREDKYGIFEAEFVGFIHAVRLAKNSLAPSRRQIKIVLDNQSVVKEMAHKKTSFSALTHKIAAMQLITDLEVIAARAKVTLRWCPGHEGVEGNKKADKLATTAAKKPLPANHPRKPTIASFRAAIKEWTQKATIDSTHLKTLSD